MIKGIKILAHSGDWGAAQPLQGCPEKVEDGTEALAEVFLILFGLQGPLQGLVHRKELEHGLIQGPLAPSLPLLGHLLR